MRPAHTIGPLVTDGIPERHVILDTEAHRQPRGDGERQTFALAVAAYLRVAPAAGAALNHTEVYTSPGALWQDVLDFTRHRHRTVVWAHNLAYDLRISQALRILPELGLDLDGIVLDYTSAWAAFSGDSRTILCCDLTSWLPAELTAIARDLQVLDRSEIGPSATLEQLQKRCESDVRVTGLAVRELLDLVQGNHLGPWRATGAGQSHAAWRRSWFTTGPYCHDREDTLEAERRAMWTGRCEAWRWGVQRDGPFYEYDLELAYPSIVAGIEVPDRLAGKMENLNLVRLLRLSDTYAVMARVVADINLPVLPHGHANRIHWPEGRVESVVWDPELSLLQQHAQNITVLEAWLYHRSDCLQEFARWLVEQATGASTDITPVQRRALKHMSRAFVGRFALRYREWGHHARMPDTRIKLGESFDRDTGERVQTLQVGHSYMHLSGYELGRDACPQITGWVMSECRRRLWELCETAGLDNVLYMDTDSLIVTPRGGASLDRAIAAGGAYGLRLKARHRYLRIDGPRQLHFRAARRVAGVPRRAVEVKPGVYKGELFEGLSEAVRGGEGEAVNVLPHTWRLDGIDTRRDHLPGGLTAPHHVG
jgi:hypothetical protein